MEANVQNMQSSSFTRSVTLHGGVRGPPAAEANPGMDVCWTTASQRRIGTAYGRLGQVSSHDVQESGIDSRLW